MNNVSMGIEEVLEQCLTLLERGVSVEDCLSRFPLYTEELREILSLASELDTITAPLMTRSQMQRMQNDIFARIDKPSFWGQIVSRPLMLMSTATAVVILIVGGIVFTLNQDDTSTETVVAEVSPSLETPEPVDTVTAIAIVPTEIPTEESTETDIPPSVTDVPPSETATDEATTTDTPTTEPSATDTATVIPTEVPDETLALPVFIDYAGQVNEIDTENSQVEIAGVTVVLSEENLQSIEIGDYVAVSGLLEDDGILEADILEETTAEAIEDNKRECDVDVSEESEKDCHPILLILSDTFQVPYEELSDLHEDGFGVGEISRLYLLADATETDVDEFIKFRQDGMSWAEMISMFPTLSPDELALGIIIGDGCGQTMQPDVEGIRIHEGCLINEDTVIGDDNNTSGQNNSLPTAVNTSVPPVNTVVPPPVSTNPPPPINTPVPPPPTDAPTDPPPQMVTICHNGNTITVDYDAWINAHSQHGDTMGACE